MTGSPDFSRDFRERLIELFRWRRDVRRFRRDPLPDGALDRLLETACLAPSVGLSEPWRFVVVDALSRRDAIRACFEKCNAAALRSQSDDRAALYARLKLAGLDDAPCQLAVFADRATSQGHGLGRQTMPEAIEYSATMAIHTLWLAARSEGIGLGWVSILEPETVSRLLDVPSDWTFVAYLCLGLPLEETDVPTLMREGWESRRAPVILQR
jgi:5,6-dimethylbenzimidazole synthase